MNYQDFMSQYRVQCKCYAVYKNKETKIIERGLILDTPINSLTDTPFVPVNNQATRIPLADIIAIIVTKAKWTN